MEYDKAYALARSIRESEEFRSVKALYAKIDQDVHTKRMLKDFRQRERELSLKQLSGEEVGQQELDQLQKLYETITLNPDIKNLFEAEHRLQLLYQDIQKIIFEPFNEIFSYHDREE